MDNVQNCDSYSNKSLSEFYKSRSIQSLSLAVDPYWSHSQCLYQAVSRKLQNFAL
jgi:hypothetical protein